MVRWGLNVMLVRDITDAMYNPADPPVCQPRQWDATGHRVYREVLVSDDMQPRFDGNFVARAERKIVLLRINHRKIVDVFGDSLQDFAWRNCGRQAFTNHSRLQPVKAGPYVLLLASAVVVWYDKRGI